MGLCSPKSNGGSGISHRGGNGRRDSRPEGSASLAAARTHNDPSRSGASFRGNGSLVNGNGRAKGRRQRRQPTVIDSLMLRKEIIFWAMASWFFGLVLVELYFFYSAIDVLDHELLTGRTGNDFDSGDRRRPPRPSEPPPPKKTLLPKKVIAVFGPESSGTTFLSTTLGVAVGAFTEDGGWFHVPAWAFPHDTDVTGRMRHLDGEWTYEKDVERRAMSSDGEWEIQHLSLPWGWLCEKDDDIHVVEALVPEECFLYQSHPHLHPKSAEKLWSPPKWKKFGSLSFKPGGKPKVFPFLKKHRGERADADKNAHRAKRTGSEENATKRDQEKQRVAAMCRDEVKISSKENDGWTCGATCGMRTFDGYALYPQRFFVNITSHIEWYLSRGVDIKVVLSMRDQTISSKGKQTGHCHLTNDGRREDEAALGLMKEAMERDALQEDASGKELVILASYEGLMEMRGAYLFDLYRRVGINSTYVPSFDDGNRKYVGNINAKEKEQLQQVEVESPDSQPPPQSYLAPPPKEHLLPKKVITVVGSESSGTKFLASTLGVATGSFSRKGQWDHIVLPSGDSSPSFEDNVFHQYNYRRAMSSDGEWEVQHLSLPWGWVCEGGAHVGAVEIVEALVPAECFRYEANPDLDPGSAERSWSIGDRSEHRATARGARKRGSARFPKTDAAEIDRSDVLGHPPEATAGEANLAERCRNEVYIAEDSANSTCGAKCGRGQHNGFALYPKRFFVNVTSHIEWYLSRGVEITALISVRDHSISRKGKLRDHCHVRTVAEEEYDVALSLLKEALTKYGKGKSRSRPNAIVASYEGLMKFQGAYLSYLYRQLGITSSYMPRFEDGNKKYVVDPPTKRESTPINRKGPKRPPLNLPWFEQFEDRLKNYVTDHPPKWNPMLPKRNHPKEFLLPKKVITVFGPESSGTTFLTSTLGAAVGVSDGTEAISRQTMSLNGEWEIQHLSLPWGWVCEEDRDINVVEALVPEECFRYEKDPTLESRMAAQNFFSEMKTGKAHKVKKHGKKVMEEDKTLMSRCRSEVKISEENNGWTCGATCGTGNYTGFALYPQRFFVNITSHIEWYLSRGVDIRVVLSMRDRTISSKGKRLRGHCQLADVARREDEIALNIMAEAMQAYGKRGSRRGLLPEDAMGKERVFPVSYEGLMQMQEVYLHPLYKELGIHSTYTPNFVDGNKKYVTNTSLANLGTQGLEHELRRQKTELKQSPPKEQNHRPPSSRESFLPKKLITVVCANNEDEVARFDLTTILSVAAGAFQNEGRWVKESLSPPYDSGSSDEHVENMHKLVFEGSGRTVAASINGGLAIQHLSLPWVSTCDKIDYEANLVESLVPTECFRFESSALVPEDPKIMERCRNEVHIAEDSANWTCGAKCGRGQSNGVAFYPKRFFVNITSHIEWYLSRGVDIAVVLMVRDHSVLMEEKRSHVCPMIEIAEKENKIEMKIIKEAYKKYGKHGSSLKSGDKERVIMAHYEGIMEMREVYLFDLYHQLGIKSTYVPLFIDGNVKHVAADSVLKAALKDEATRHKDKFAWRHKERAAKRQYPWEAAEDEPYLRGGGHHLVQY